MDNQLCGILDLRNKCKDVLGEVIPLCEEACTESGKNPRGIMGDACYNYHPTDSKHSCAAIMSYMEFEDNQAKCENILNDLEGNLHDKLACSTRYYMVSELNNKNIGGIVASDEINIVKKVASDSSF